MNKVSEVGHEASQTLAEPESQERRLFVKGVVGLGAAFASSSLLSATVQAQADSRQKAPTGNGVSSAQGDWGPLHPPEIQAATCSYNIHPQQKLGNCNLVSHTPFGFPMESRPCEL
jgi:hypothetical protein